MSTTMSKMVLFDEIGGPEVLRIGELDLGEPGPGEVRIRVDAFGLNRAEVLFRAGTYYYQPTLPVSRNGYEAAGVVESVGEGVRDFAPGDPVSTFRVPELSAYGVHGEHAVLSAADLVHRADGIDAVTGTSVWLTYSTAYGALVETAGMRPGDTVLITAGSSAVSLAAIQVANHLGAIPVVTTRTAAKRQRLLDAGAAHVIALDEGDLVKRVQAVTDGHGADLAFDSVGGPELEEVAAALVPGGSITVYGWLNPDRALLPRNWPQTIHTYANMALMADAKVRRRTVHFVNAGLRSGSFKPVIDHVYDGLEQVTQAHRRMESNDQFGKLVVTVRH
ncbi:zinc-dependent alcohol dehydrogenase family protein [Streptomyces sp. NBC_01537]|uniref:zinc-dependent alcohol dehydrogenase family protein n=1 Tax=Streptomyces sp. NBC_01537 TaxID=2903896 RepID=UPI003868E926